MGRAPSPRIVIVVVVLVGTLGVTGWVLSRSGPSSRPAVESNAVATSPATLARSDSGPAAEAKPPTLDDLPRPALTAAWMTEPANPLIVEMTAGDRDEEQKITPGGGEIELTLETGDHVTLRVPAGALTRNAELRLQSVTMINGWPHAPGTVISVLVSAKPAVLLRNAFLTIERRTRRNRPPPLAMAGFAVDSEKRELHLYPATRAGDENGERFTMPIARFGAYGIVEAARTDVEAMHARTPTDLLARIEADLAVGLLERAQTAGSASLRADVVLASLQSAGGFPAFVPEWMAGVLAQLRDYYQQVLLFYVGAITPSCSRDAVPFFLMLHAKVVEWEHLVQELIRSTEGGAASPDVEGYWREIRADFETKIRTLGDHLDDHVKRLFAAIETCCKHTPQDWMPASMLDVVHHADGYGIGETVLGPDRWERVDTCKCAANILNGIARWRGTITHNETFEPPPTVTIAGNRAAINSAKQTYSAQIILTRERNDSHVGFVRARGTRATGTDFHEETTATNEKCGYVWKKHYATSLTGEYDDEDVVGLSVRADGTYTITYPTPPATGTEWIESNSVFTGACMDWLIRQNNWDRSDTRYGEGVSGSELGELGGKLNEADKTRLKETVERSRPWVLNGVDGILHARITWDLTRCVATAGR